MSEGASDDDDKPFDPTQKRLDDARKRGEIPRSQDLTTAAVYGGFLIALITAGGRAADGIASLGAGIIRHADRMPFALLQIEPAPLAGVFRAVAWATAPLFLLPLLGAILSISLQRAWIFTPDNLMPRASRISVVSTFGKKFGLDGLAEFGKSVIKTTLVSVLLTVFVLRELDLLTGAMRMAPNQIVALLADQIIRFMMLLVVVAGVIGVADFLWQRVRHTARNRMSRKDMTDEHKDSEGDPHVKSQRRQKAQAIAMNQMLSDVGGADVVIVNPTHYAVALKWDRQNHRAPVCVAKGTDEIAARIRERAAEMGVPIHRDPPTARALFATIEIGQEIQKEQYRAVAAAIRFAVAMRKKAKGLA